jgi:nicotinamide riboside kinase
VFWSAASVICGGDFLTLFATVYVGQEHVRLSKVWIQYYFTLFILASRATAGQYSDDELNAL